MTDQPPDDDDDRSRANLIGLLVVILLVVGMVFLLLELKKGIALETCIARGRHDCNPIEIPPE